MWQQRSWWVLARGAGRSVRPGKGGGFLSDLERPDRELGRRTRPVFLRVQLAGAAPQGPRLGGVSRPRGNPGSPWLGASIQADRPGPPRRCEARDGEGRVKPPPRPGGGAAAGESPRLARAQDPGAAAGGRPPRLPGRAWRLGCAAGGLRGRAARLPGDSSAPAPTPQSPSSLLPRTGGGGDRLFRSSSTAVAARLSAPRTRPLATAPPARQRLCPFQGQATERVPGLLWTWFCLS